MALGALIIKGRLGLTDEELVEQIKENPYLQFFLGLERFQYLTSFGPSMMVYFRKRLPESVVNDINERIVLHDFNLIHSSTASNHDDDGGNQGSETGLPDNQQTRSDSPRPNQGSLLIYATSAPVDIRHSTVFSLLNEGRELSEMLIDAFHAEDRYAFVQTPRTHRKQARHQFLALAEKKRPRINKICKAIKHKLTNILPNRLWWKPSGRWTIRLPEAFGCQRAGASAKYSLPL